MELDWALSSDILIPGLMFSKVESLISVCKSSLDSWFALPLRFLLVLDKKLGVSSYFWLICSWLSCCCLSISRNFGALSRPSFFFEVIWFMSGLMLWLLVLEGCCLKIYFALLLFLGVIALSITLNWLEGESCSLSKVGEPITSFIFMRGSSSWVSSVWLKTSWQPSSHKWSLSLE